MPGAPPTMPARSPAPSGGSATSLSPIASSICSPAWRFEGSTSPRCDGPNGPASSSTTGARSSACSGRSRSCDCAGPRGLAARSGPRPHQLEFALGPGAVPAELLGCDPRAVLLSPTRLRKTTAFMRRSWRRVPPARRRPEHGRWIRVDLRCRSSTPAVMPLAVKGRAARVVAPPPVKPRPPPSLTGASISWEARQLRRARNGELPPIRLPYIHDKVMGPPERTWFDDMT